MSDNDGSVMIGLEIHVQLTNLKTKLFCSCSADYRGDKPNTHVCPICIGLPGSLPVLNKKVIEFATRLALALGCKINHTFWFFRKNYYYPDMAKNFQISQYNKAGGKAFADGGFITIFVNEEPKKIRLNRIHLEEDPARLVHEGSISKSPHAYVDYNRSGTALIEIVSEPDLETPEEARKFLRQLLSIVQYTEISDPTLEGAYRVDCNISIRGHERSEVKNINSLREAEKALKWEIKRQKNEIKRGRKLTQETRHWDGNITILLRSKEFEADYRYFPEQDLVPIELSQDFIDDVRSKLPEMPNERKNRFQEVYNLSEFDSSLLVLDKNIADFFETGVKSEKSFGKEDYKSYCNWLMGDISRWLNDNNKSIKETKLKPKQLVDLIKFVKAGKITGKIAKSFVDEMMKGSFVDEMIKKSGKIRIADKDKITAIAKEVIKENSKIVKDYERNPKALQALIGKVMAKTKGQADPKITRDIMLKLIKKKFN